MSCYLVYPSFPLIDVVGAMSLVITLLDASGFKAQIVAPRDGIWATVPVIPEVSQHFQRSLGISRIRCVILEVVWACSHGDPWLGAATVEVTISGLFLRR